MTTTALRVPEVTRRLSLSRCTVYVAIQKGELPCIRFGRAVRVLEADLDAWVEAHRQAPSDWTDDAVAALMESIE
jgi:excisionase family DNA binding protein